MKKSEHDHVVWRRLRVLLPVGVVSAATVLGVSLAGAQQTVQKGPPPPTAAQIAALKSAALTFAQENGDANPIRGELVGGTRASVVPLLMNGAEANTDPNVYVIELEGTFTAYQLPMPAGASPPKGRFLTLVYDSTTGVLTDWGISNQHRDLAPFGPPQTILP